MNYADLLRVTMPETVLEAAALLVLFIDLGFLRKSSVRLRIAAAAVLGILGCGFALMTLPLQALGGLQAGGDQLLAAGGSTAVAQVGILGLTVLTLLLLFDSTFTRHVGEFVAITLMSATGGMLIAAAQDLLVIFIGLELLSLGLYVLTAFAKKSGKSAEAAMKYYLFGGMSAAFLLFGFSYLYGISGSTSLHQIMQATYGSKGINATPLLMVALIMIAAGLGFKVAAAPFHLWAPDAYEGAPAPAAAFIASVSKIASFALLISIGTAALHVFGDAHVVRTAVFDLSSSGKIPRFIGFGTPWSFALTILAVASMLLGNLAALAQTSVRRLLAYSAVAHAGYILLALAYFSQGPVSAHAVLYYILTYGLTVIGAFAVVGVVERVQGSDQMDAFAGLHRRSPILAGVMLVLFLSLAGIPPLVGFWAKFNLFTAVLGVAKGSVPFGLVALAVAMSTVSLYYYLQVLKRAFVVPALDDSRIAVHPVTLAALLVVTLWVVLAGCFPAILQGWMQQFYA